MSCRIKYLFSKKQKCQVKFFKSQNHYEDLTFSIVAGIFFLKNVETLVYGVCYKDGIFANTKMKFDFFFPLLVYRRMPVQQNLQYTTHDDVLCLV